MRARRKSLSIAIRATWLAKAPKRKKDYGKTRDYSENYPTPRKRTRLTRGEFERRYAAMSYLKKAELLEGVVYIGSPVQVDQYGNPHAIIVMWLGVYQAATSGTQVGDNCTVRLDVDNEPQPDAFLRILPEYGGQSRTSEDGYVEGAPELIAEVAASGVSIDS